MAEIRRVSRFLVGKSSEKTSLGIPSLKWVDNTKVVLKEVGGGYKLD